MAGHMALETFSSREEEYLNISSRYVNLHSTDS